MKFVLNKSIINRCWDNNSHQRPSMKDILEFTNQWKLSIMESNLKSVEMNKNKLGDNQRQIEN